MDKPKKHLPSLRDFDYFADDVDIKITVVPNPADVLTDGPGDRGAANASREGDAPDGNASRHVEPRQIISLVLTTAFLLFAAWFAWQFRDYARYAFAPAQAPLLLGNVTEITPEMIPHNAYVSIYGITEHRGIHARAVRGLTLHHDEYWYFRLMGSRGVFIEVAPDAENYGPNTEVTVQGRVVDPDLDPLYASLLKSYEDTFVTELRAHRRVIQVGFAPGQGRGRYAVAIALFIGCAGIFTYNGWRAARGLWRGKRTSG